MTQFSRHRARGFRDGAGLSRQALAARIGCSIEAVHAWESGRSAPSRESLKALASALRVIPGDLEQVHDDPVQDYVSAVLYDAPPVPPDALDAAARVLRRTRRVPGGEPAA